MLVSWVLDKEMQTRGEVRAGSKIAFAVECSADGLGGMQAARNVLVKGRGGSSSWGVV